MKPIHPLVTGKCTISRLYKMTLIQSNKHVIKSNLKNDTYR